MISDEKSLKILNNNKRKKKYTLEEAKLIKEKLEVLAKIDFEKLKNYKNECNNI